jgi:hypothetical protein
MLTAPGDLAGFGNPQPPEDGPGGGGPIDPALDRLMTTIGASTTDLKERLRREYHPQEVDHLVALARH